MATEKHRKTRKSWNEIGHAHFLTYSCHQGLPSLNRDRSRQWVIDAMIDARERQKLDLLAYVIMPEHVHLLLFPNDPDYEMRYILNALKRPVSDAAKNHLIRTNQTHWIERLTVRYPSRHVFRFRRPGGGYDRNVFQQRKLSQLIEYIHANPVRRGLVDTPTEWRWSSAGFWEGETEVPIRMDDFEV
jgi:REP-associated tyrosine transposase